MDTDLYFFYNDKIPSALTKKETYQLLKEMFQGNETARNKLIIHNIRLVIYEVRVKFNTIKHNKQDLVSSGLIGLIKAVSSFDLNKGVDFTTYALICIDNEIKGFLRNYNKHKNVDSLEKIISLPEYDNEIKIADLIASELNILDDYILEEEYSEINLLLNELSEKERKIIMMHFGFYENRIYTQEEIARHLNVSQPCISRTTKKILKKLKSKVISQQK